MELSTILTPEAVKSVSSVGSKKRILQDVSDLAASVYGISGDLALSALQERESLGPTSVGDGVAIPHARIDGIEKVLGVFYRLEKPMDYDAVDRQPVDLVFALFAPTASGVDHLKALALVSRIMRDPATRSKLRSNEAPSTIYAILTEMSETKAA